MILKMYITMTPVIMAGILNMLFVKMPFFDKIKHPIDNGRILRDGKRLFGDNKTIAGFIGMIAAGAVSQLLWGFVCLSFPEKCYIYSCFANTPLFNLAAGAVMGFAYVLFELPNSFIKRRLDIPCGKTVGGFCGKVFFLIDQVDSLFGVAAVFAFLYPMSVGHYFLYILLGAVTHITVNSLLYALKIRKNL